MYKPTKLILLASAAIEIGWQIEQLREIGRDEGRTGDFRPLGQHQPATNHRPPGCSHSKCAEQCFFAVQRCLIRIGLHECK